MVQIMHGIAGGLAGITVDVVFYPLQTIKTRIMATSLKQNLMQIALSRFRGFSCQMIVSFPYSFSFFATYETVRHYTNKSFIANAFASVCAETVGNIVRNPFQIVKQQLMVGRSSQIWQSLLDIKNNKGYKGFYIGFRPTLIRDIVFSAVQLPIFQFIRVRLMEKNVDSIVSASVGGFIAAAIAGFFSCPLDVVKTRLMTQKMYQNTGYNIYKQIYKEYGLKGFFRGVGFRCGILSFGGIIYFGSLQAFRNLLQIH